MTTMTKPATATSSIYPVLPACDLERAEHFYHDVLGMEIEKLPESDGQFMAHAGGSSWVLVYKTEFPHSDATAATFMVDDLPSVVEDLRSRGVSFEDYDMPGLTTVNGIAELPSERAAWFKDSEGNTISIGELLH